MGGAFSPSPATSNQTTNTTTAYYPDAGTMASWQNILGTAGGLENYLVNNNQTYPGQAVAPPTDLTSQYWSQAPAATTAPGMADFQRGMTNIGGADINQYVDPNQINLNQNYNFQPGQANLPTTFSGGTPQVNAPGGVSGLASYYQVNPQQVTSGTVTPQMITAPGAINPITGLAQIQAPTLRNYQMGPATNVNAPTLSNFQMQAAGNVAPQAQVGTQSWTDPGTAASFMSPYTQQVVSAQQAYATQAYQQQREQENAQEAQAGAFGGTRGAVQQGINDQSYQMQLAQIQAQGLQNAYQQGAQQFNQQQQLGLQGQQFNVQTGLQAALANQQAQQQANVQNLSSFLQTQGLGAQTGLQAALANQQAGLTVGQQNLAANLQTQGLGAQLGMQGQLANQQTGLQSAIANQQAQEFGAGQQLQASLANQQAGLQAGIFNTQSGLQAALANQQAGIQTGLAAQQMGLQGAQFNAGQGLQAGLANQAAQMQALGMQYQGGLAAALQGQNLGYQGQVQGAQMGLTAAAQQEQLRQAQQGMNLSGFNQAANIYNQAGQLGLAGFGANLQGQGALAQAAMSQQGYQQQLADQAYQQWLQNQQAPMQAVSWLAGLQSMAPLPYNQRTSGTVSGTNMPAQPSIGGQILGGVLGGLGTIFGAAKGGGVPSDAALDRQVLDRLLRRQGGLKAALAPRGGASVIAFPRRRPMGLPEIETLERAAYRRPAGLGVFAHA